MKTYFQLSIRMANTEIKILLLLKKGNLQVAQNVKRILQRINSSS